MNFERSDMKDREPLKTELTEEDIKKHIEEAGSIEWVRMGELLRDIPESCVDGREQKGMIGTPGGNAGEFVLALGAAEEASSVQIQPIQMDLIMKRYLEVNGKFYIHTDTHALDHLGIQEEQLRNPSLDEQKELLQKIVQPENMGCGHLREMTKTPEEYGVRGELVRKAVQTIYQAYWRREDVELLVLDGEHQERAVVNILVDGEVSEDTKIPTVSPSVNGDQIFVNHPQAVQFMREQTTAKIIDIIGFNLDKKKFARQQKILGEQQLSATLSRLANGLPVFDLVFEQRKINRIEKQIKKNS